jgi:putative transposase
VIAPEWDAFLASLGRPAAQVRSQSVKTAGAGGEAGYDAGKKVKGRKRHLRVDSLGLLLAVAVTGAGVHDARTACDLLHRRCGTSCRG